MSTKPILRRICILGAGFNGLGCAKTILSNNDDNYYNEIIIISKEFTPNTTSDVAGGLWLPNKLYHPNALEWCTYTYEYLVSLKDQIIDGRKNPYGINMSRVIFFVGNKESQSGFNSWKDGVPGGYEKIDLNTIKHPSTATAAYQMNVPIVITSLYLEQLYKDLLETNQVKMVKKTISSIQEIIDEYNPDVVINCLGLASRDVVPDPLIYPTRGALVCVSPKVEYESKILNTAYLYRDNPDGLSYIIGRPDGCYVGGTAYDHSWNLSVDEHEAKDLLNRGKELCEYLEGAKIVGTKVGLRPTRNPIRVEIDFSYPSTMVIHNYGHGGSGLTMHWGSAKYVYELLQSHYIDFTRKSKL